MMSDRGLPRPTRLTADRPMSGELIDLLRIRVQTRYYDRAEIVDAVARTIAMRADVSG